MTLGRKTGGRKKGGVNRTTTDVREAIAQVASACAPQIQGWLNQVEDPEKRLRMFSALLEYHIPKLGRTELTGPGGGDLNISINDPTRRPITK